MVDRNKNQRPRSRYFLDRRDFVRQSSAKQSKPMFPDAPEPVKPVNIEDPEVESKLKTLYDSLNTGFWDTEPKLKKRKNKSGHSSQVSARKKARLAYIKSQTLVVFTKIKTTNTRIEYKNLLKQKRVALPVAGLFGILALAVVFSGGQEQKSGSIATTVKGASTVNLDKTPYKPLMPRADEKGQAAHNSLNYEPTKKVFSFSDQINNGKGIIVSQQLFPEDYRDDPISGLTSIASNLGASQWLASSRGKVFYSTNEKGQGVTAVFTYKDILVIMRTSAYVSEDEMRKYVDKLEPS